MSMRRQINWPAMQRDMKRYRSPEQMLIREMAETLGKWSHDGALQTFENRERFRAAARALVTKAERHTHG
jgi:hypothetical protein